MTEIINAESDKFLYNGPRKGLELLSAEQLNLLQSTTVFNTGELSKYTSVENLLSK